LVLLLFKEIELVLFVNNSYLLDFTRSNPLRFFSLILSFYINHSAKSYKSKLLTPYPLIYADTRYFCISVRISI
jgi:hypothetical protein